MVSWPVSLLRPRSTFCGRISRNSSRSRSYPPPPRRPADRAGGTRHRRAEHDAPAPSFVDDDQPADTEAVRGLLTGRTEHDDTNRGKCGRGEQPPALEGTLESFDALEQPNVVANRNPVWLRSSGRARWQQRVGCSYPHRRPFDAVRKLRRALVNSSVCPPWPLRHRPASRPGKILESSKVNEHNPGSFGSDQVQLQVGTRSAPDLSAVPFDSNSAVASLYACSHTLRGPDGSTVRT
jgi:hypothetical protein